MKKENCWLLLGILFWLERSSRPAERHIWNRDNRLGAQLRIYKRDTDDGYYYLQRASDGKIRRNKKSTHD